MTLLIFLAACSSELAPPVPPVVAVPVTELPRVVLGDGFVSEDSCGDCHPTEVEAWRGSHHDLAMQTATAETVLGDFDEVSFSAGGVETRFRRDSDRFLVTTLGPDGETATYPVTHTFGVHPLQQYLVALPGGHLQCLTVAWDAVAGRWIELEPEAADDPSSPVHWSGRLYRWNDRCADCHSTNVRLGYAADGTFQTTYAREDVGCQACHGPAGGHLAWTEGDETAQAEDPTHGLEIDTGTWDSVAEVEACAPCHSRRHPVTPEPEPGGSFLDDYMPALLRDDLYHADGQIDEEVFVYGSFAQSKMYARGVACGDCHDPHALELKAPGNATCVQCHNPAGNPRFTTLQKKAYDTPAHHFHETGAVGSQCVDCHMPATTYMKVDPRRDHSMRVPRPDLTVAHGVPNACNSCHPSQSPQWAADQIEAWYGGTREASYAQIFTEARAGADRGAALTALVGDRDQPGIVRATALDLLGPSGAETALSALEDTDPLLRTTAIRGAEYLPPERWVTGVWPLLSDPIRAVRIEAGRALAAVPSGELEPDKRAALAAAIADYEAAQHASGHQPEPYLNLGILKTRQGLGAEAEAAYQRAIEIDGRALPPRVNLANLYNQLGRNPEARFQLEQALTFHPEEGELYYSLGLLTAEMNEVAAATGHLQRAAELMPARPRVHFNLGKLLAFAGDIAGGEQALRRAYELDPDNTEFITELIRFYLGTGQSKRALPLAEDLAARFPDDPGIRQMVDQLRKNH